jgi:hypothetical protein
MPPFAWKTGAGSKAASASFFEKKEAKKLPDFGSVVPQPAKPINPTFGFARRGLLASPVAASPNPTNEVLFASFSFRKKKTLASLASLASQAVSRGPVNTLLLRLAQSAAICTMAP